MPHSARPIEIPAAYRARQSRHFKILFESMPRASGRPAWFAWWYVCIAAGFVLLAIRQILIGGLPTGIVVRIVIALAFAALAYSEMRRNVG
jgi:hypothetical protein